ncbi:MAG: LuxR C-terminal-related transcriptional regulator [Marmoricola sp.]
MNDYEIVVKGLARMLEPYADRVRVVEAAPNLPVGEQADIALYDRYSRIHDFDPDIDSVLTQCNARRLVIYSWNLHPELVRSSLNSGADGYLGKRLPAAELVEALERIHAGEIVVTEDDITDVPQIGDWPGRNHGLTTRESEISALITRGPGNKQIADRAFLSVNSVKSYSRSIYRKMGVTSRSRAVLWGIEHSFRPDHVRMGPADHAR